MIVDKVTGQLTVIEHYNLSIIIAALFSRIKIAFIDPKEHTFELNKFGEAIVFSRGGKALICRSEAEGLEWLLNNSYLARILKNTYFFLYMQKTN
jgi:hypothetical protein